MKIKALLNFSGPVSMSKEEEREMEMSGTLKELLKCGYVEPAESRKAEEPVESEDPGPESEEKVKTVGKRARQAK